MKLQVLANWFWVGVGLLGGPKENVKVLNM